MATDTLYTFLGGSDALGMRSCGFGSYHLAQHRGLVVGLALQLLSARYEMLLHQFRLPSTKATSISSY